MASECFFCINPIRVVLLDEHEPSNYLQIRFTYKCVGQFNFSKADKRATL